MSLLPDGALIVWKWGIGSDSSGSDGDENADEKNDKADCAGQSSGSDSREDPQSSHMLTFKCIGTTRESRYQEVLRIISNQKPVEQVEVKLQCEPDNPVDSKAIAFVATIQDKQCRIGYAVREVLDELHQAIREKKILCVTFSWVKYLVEWTRSGPGYYCGVNITKRGEWSQNAIKVRSTR